MDDLAQIHKFVKRFTSVLWRVPIFLKLEERPMKKIIGILCFLLISTQLYALNLSDIIRLSKANVGDDIILSVISVSETKLQLTTDDIIRLKQEGVSDQVIKALVKATPKKAKPAKKVNKKVRKNQEPRQRYEDGRELSPFDQFFLSTYYSTQYGWPERNYRSKQDILGQGLYYQSPTFYPNARSVRLYGQSNSFDRFGNFNSSPYSIIVPRRHLHNGYNNNFHRYRGKRYRKYNKNRKYK